MVGVERGGNKRYVHQVYKYGCTLRSISDPFYLDDSSYSIYFPQKINKIENLHFKSILNVLNLKINVM